MSNNKRNKPFHRLTKEEQEEQIKSPEIADEESMEGSTPLPESDDDIDKEMKKRDLYTETDPEEHPELGGENPHPADIAEEFEEAEKAHRRGED